MGDRHRESEVGRGRERDGEVESEICASDYYCIEALCSQRMCSIDRGAQYTRA